MKFITPLFFYLMASSVLAQNYADAINYYENKQPVKSERILKAVDENSKNYADAQFYLGRIAFDQEDYDAAEEYFEEAIDQNDSNSDYHLWLGNTFGVVAGNSNVFKQGLLAPKIKSEYERAVELNPKSIDALWGLIEYYTQAPGFMGGSWEKALDMANKIGKVDLLQGYLARAVVYRREEKFQLAEKEYVAASKLDPAYNLNLGSFYQNREEYDKAFETYEALSLNNDHKLNAIYQYGKTSALSGKNTEKGITYLKEYLNNEPKKNSPSHAGARMRLGMIYEKTGQKSKAIDYYSQSLKEDPDMKQAKEGLKRLR